MDNFESFFKNILNLVKDDAFDEFDMNFMRKAFFNNKWPGSKRKGGRGTLMMRSGLLRAGNNAKVSGSNIHFTNSRTYAALHNQGGTLTITTQMKKFFWAMYCQYAGKVKKKKDGSVSKGSVNLNADAQFWKSLALKKVGSKMIIPKRQWIGAHPNIDKIVEKHFKAEMEAANQQINNLLR